MLCIASFTIFPYCDKATLSRISFLFGNTFSLSIFITQSIITQIGRENNISAEICWYIRRGVHCTSADENFGIAEIYGRPYGMLSKLPYEKSRKVRDFACSSIFFLKQKMPENGHFAVKKSNLFLSFSAGG